MKNSLFLILLTCIAFIGTLNGQSFSKGYLDSAKEFFTDLAAANGISSSFIALEIPKDPHSFNMQYESNKLVNTPDNHTIYYYKENGNVNEFGGKRYVKTDSIVLAKNDKKKISDELQKQGSYKFQWSKWFFPNATLVENRYLDSVFANGLFSKQFPKGISGFSLPVFLYGTPYCALFELNIPCRDGGSQRIELYKKENGLWRDFGSIVSGDW